MTPWSRKLRRREKGCVDGEGAGRRDEEGWGVTQISLAGAQPSAKMIQQHAHDTIEEKIEAEL